jgi:hypothetical protein
MSCCGLASFGLHMRCDRLVIIINGKDLFLSVESITSNSIRKETPQSNHIGSLVSIRVIIE